VRKPIVEVTKTKMAAIFMPKVFMSAYAIDRPTA
jgi:hypothetical protein